MYKYPDIDENLIKIAESAEDELKEIFGKIDEISEVNQYKVLKAFQDNRVSDSCFNISTGYGYNDTGRDTLEAVYKDVFHTEDALVRPYITCGTHAIYLSMKANLLPGDELLFASGMPYDSLHSSIGITSCPGSLMESGVSIKVVDLIDGKDFDLEKISENINEKTKMVHIQRSKGYSTRDSLSVEKIKDVITHIKNIDSSIIINVDNCYGEFTDIYEPSDVGADLCVGSLIKNPGGGLSPSGGYIVGRSDLIERCAYMLTAPGLGKEVGSSLGSVRPYYQGLSLAPKVVSESLKNAHLLAYMANRFGYKCYPEFNEKHACIVQAVEFNDRDKLKAFCEAIQKASYVDSFVRPVASYMPGYEDDVIMASGSFISGSSIEISADGPLREPYVVYFQGGLTHEQGKYAILSAIDSVQKK